MDDANLVQLPDAVGQRLAQKPLLGLTGAAHLRNVLRRELLRRNARHCDVIVALTTEKVHDAHIVAVRSFVDRFVEQGLLGLVLFAILPPLFRLLGRIHGRILRVNGAEELLQKVVLPILLRDAPLAETGVVAFQCACNKVAIVVCISHFTSSCSDR